MWDSFRSNVRAVDEEGRPKGSQRASSPSNPPKKKRFRGRGWVFFKRALFALCLLGVAGIVAAIVLIRSYEADLPSIQDLRQNYHPPQTTRILARDGSILAELFTERRTIVPIKDLPPHVKLAILAAEDASFYEHEGLNYFGIFRAVIVNLKSGRFRQGGSTITQQVIKNVVLTAEKTFDRKIKEALLARRLEQNLSKDEILEIYMNHIYFSRGRYGVEEASRDIFGKSAKDLTYAEAAMLAGSIKGPMYSPHSDLARSTERRNVVLEQMHEKGFLDDARYEAARQEPVHLAPISSNENGKLIPEVIEIVRKELHEREKEKAALGGYTIYTTIDRHLQEVARKSVLDGLRLYDKRHALLGPLKGPSPISDKKPRAPVKDPNPLFEGTPEFKAHKIHVGEIVGTDDAKGTIQIRVGTVVGFIKLADYERYNPAHLVPSLFAPAGTRLRVSLLAPPNDDKTPLRLESGPEAALVSIDVRSREVLALIGNYEAASGGLDRASQARRQPGSTFKPVVYSFAIHTRKYTPASLIDVTPGVFAGGYKPSNYEGWKGVEALRLREVLANSVNVGAVRVLEDVGPAGVVDWGKSLGITSKLGADLSLALGSYEVSPLELAGAYATFAAGGQYEAPRLIRRITGPDGKDVELSPTIPSHRVLEENEAYVITHMMTSVIDHGTGARAKELGRPLAGKTGTSNAAKDTWFAGSSPETTTVVWVGYDDGRPLGPAESGAQTALPLWMSFMRTAHEGKPKSDFPIPNGIKRVVIDKKTGLLPFDGDAETMEEVFLDGTEPTLVSPVRDPDAGVGPDGGAFDPTTADGLDAGL